LRVFKPAFAAMASANALDQALDLIQATQLKVSPAELVLLKAELPVYQAQANGASADVAPLEFFAARQAVLPTLFKLLQRACLFYPSSAFAERCFSILNIIMSDQRSNILEETVETELLFRLNP
jgi:squalene cyclase